MNSFLQVKEIVNLNIDDKLLTAIVFEISRFFDSQLTKEYKRIQNENNVILDTPTRKILRKKYYYGDIFSIDTEYDIIPVQYSLEDINAVFEDCLARLNKYDSEKIINSMKRRVDDLNDNVDSDSNMIEWLKSYNDRRKSKEFSLLVFTLDQEEFVSCNYDENIITNFIIETYSSLANYRHLAIVINGEIFNKSNECITWNLMYKAGIFAENFVQFKEKFFPFKKEQQISILKDFLNDRKIDKADKLATDFYSAISTGYKFEDCYVSDNQDCKIMLYKKIELDESPVPCPSCNTTIQRGNSYPEVFLRSYECANPNCPDRSKSGRGKRFDEYGTYRYFKLAEGDELNKISDETYQHWRRDVFEHDLDWKELLINEYSFAGEKVLITNSKSTIIKGRKITGNYSGCSTIQSNIIKEYSKLPIVNLFKSINKNYIINNGNSKLIGALEIINSNSSEYLQKLSSGQIGSAITSPPYYNAREYSQWSNMILYFVDMLINCKSVYESMAHNGYYLYNIGDIVSEDNVYVNSNMSKRRVQLGFLSCMIFEIAGYNLTGNIIWDKGEVQSKRNSTVNLCAGYVKCINCYEHIFVFRKGKFERISNSVEKITPVIKINNKGENTYKHTAPYPIELVELLRPYIKKKLYVLDPFLGSGTTLKWCKKNNFLGVGMEMNKEYFDLCVKNINSEASQL